MKKLGLILLIMALSGCAGLSKKTNYERETQVVWSDDESEFAIVMHETVPATQTDASGFQHRLVAQSVSGLERRGLTGLRPYRTGRVFYMHSRGYLIVESLLDSGHIKIDRIALQGGHEIPIIETRGPLSPCDGDLQGAYVETQVIPSPDGQTLAYGYSTNCGEATIEFLDARNLRVLDTQTTAIPSKATLSWHPEDYLYLALLDGKSAWQLAPKQTLLPATAPRCVFPPTSSSPYSRTGKLATLEEDKVVISDGSAEHAFGCQ